MSVRRPIAMIALSSMLTPGCNDDVSAPVDMPGALEVVVTATGARPDPDGYAVVVDIEGRGDLSSQTVGSTGGTVRFPQVAPGTHSVRLESLAANCSVQGDNPRSFTVVADETSRIGFLISCPVPGDSEGNELSGGAGIYLASADGSDATWLTSGNRPDWSPDGLRIAFDRGGQVYVINADGSNETVVNRGVDPAWSPDGKRLVFADEECPSESCSPPIHGISVMDADGSGVINLVRGDFDTSPLSPFGEGMGVGKPTWSPDGETIAFNHFGDGDLLPAQIYLMNADGSLARRLTPTTGIQYAESDPSWAPDGSTIVFWSYGYGIATVAVEGGTPATIYRNFPSVRYGATPVWSPDGNTIAFSAVENGGRLIYVVDSNGGDPRLLIGGGYHPAWSPDGARIAFAHGGG